MNKTRAKKYQMMMVLPMMMVSLLTMTGCPDTENQTSGNSGPVVDKKHFIAAGEHFQLLVDYGRNGHHNKQWRTVSGTQYDKCTIGRIYPDCAFPKK